MLQHSLTYALIEIGDPKATAVGLRALPNEMVTAALMALEQMPGGNLTAKDVANRLRAGNDQLRDAAWWVAGRHPEWGEELAPTLAAALAEKPTDELADRLAKFAGVPAVQRVLADALAGPGRPTALKAMAGSNLKAWPAAWWTAVEKLPLDAGMVAAVKAIPPTANQYATTAGPGGQQWTAGCHCWPPGRGASACRPPTSPPPSPARAVDVLGRGGLTADQLAAVADALPRAAVPDLPRLLDLFDKAPEPAVLKLLAVVAADAGLQATVRPERLRQLTDNASPSVTAAARPVLAKLEAGLADQRAKLETLLAELPKGDVRRGQQVFNGSKAVCLTCHQMGYVGGKTGPDLTRIGGTRGERDLLEAIVYPSASFVRSYEPVTATTLDGRTVNGVLRRDDAAGLVVAVSATEEVRIPRAELESLRPGTVSLMPAGFDQQLTRQELADLVAFLKASR